MSKIVSLIIIALLNCVQEMQSQTVNNCESFAVECVYCSKSLKSGTSYFSLLSDFGSVIFYNQGCLKFQQILAKTGPESEILFERFEKKLSEKVDDPLLNGNILYWELLCMNYKTDTLTLYNSQETAPFMYEEIIPRMEWKLINDSTRKILGHKCKLAVSKFRGRKWEAWYSEDLPLSLGPWKLHGLPGLILKASADSLITFEAVSINKTNRDFKQNIIDCYLSKKLEKIRREKYLQFKRRPLVIPAYNKNFPAPPYIELE